MLLIVLIVGLTACSKDKTAPVLINNATCDSTKVYYDLQIKPLIVNNCAMSGCHSKADNKGGIQLEDYLGILATVSPNNPDNSELYTSLLPTADEIMPPLPTPAFNSSQIELVKKWILQGALYNTCGGVSTCNTLSVSYSNDIAPIVSANCNGCHGPGGSMQSVPSTTYAGLKDMVDRGSLLPSIAQNGGSYSAMPPAPASKLSACAISKIETWVAAGAPNN